MDVSQNVQKHFDREWAKGVTSLAAMTVGLGYATKIIPALGAAKLPGISWLAKGVGTKAASTVLKYGWGASMVYRGGTYADYIRKGEWERGLFGLGFLGGEYLAVKVGTSGKLKLPEFKTDEFLGYKGLVYKYGTYEQALVGTYKSSAKGIDGQTLIGGKGKRMWGTPLIDVEVITKPLSGERISGAGTKALMKSFKATGLMAKEDINKFETIYGLTRGVGSTPSPYTTDLFIKKTRTLNEPEVTKVLEFAEEEGMEVVGSLSAYQQTGLKRTLTPETKSLEQFKSLLHSYTKDFEGIVKDIGIKKDWLPENEIIKISK